MIWDKLAAKYDSLWVQKYSLSPTRREVLRQITKIRPKSMLDLGCGTGQLIEAVEHQEHCYCVGIDKSSEMIELARVKNPDATFIVADISAGMPQQLYGQQFDLITCTHSFPYYSQKARAFEVVAELLSLHGAAIFVQASINNSYDSAVMAVIEKTAEKAEYLSGAEFSALAAKQFVIAEEFLIRERWFMPSICGFVLHKDGKR